MKSRDKQLRRVVRFIDEVKKGKYPNSKTFAKKLIDLDERHNTELAVCAKTIKRDISYLKNTLGAPLEYDRSEHGFYLYMEDWTFPELALSGNELFAELFTRQISMQSVLPSLKEHLETGLDVQMTVGSTEKINTSALNSVICATGKTVKVDDNISEIILEGWKNCKTLDTSYSKHKKDLSHRKLDIHALFLSEKVWYCRAFCHEKKDFRNFAMHKFRSATVTPEKFTRSTKVITALKEGHIFNYKTIPKVEVKCSSAIADFISDREWFSNQFNINNDDGSLNIIFTDVPKQALKSWVMSFSGSVAILKPQSLRKEILEAAQKLLAEHK